MALPKYQAASSQPVAASEEPVPAAPVTAPGDHPETPRLGLPLIADDADDWGDDYRHAMATLDTHPGIASVTALPEQPWDGQVVALGQHLHKFTEGVGWRMVGMATWPGRVSWGEALAVTSGAVRIVSTQVGEAGLRLRGFTATGSGDAHFRLLVGDTPLLGGRISVASPVLSLVLPVGYAVPVGSSARVQVTAGGAGLCDYEATIYGEVTDG